MSDVVLEARGVRFSWGDRQVLRGIDLQVERGSVCCLMGMNGCGKSTFLDCVLGENEPSEGRILIDGSDAAGMKASRRARLLSYVPQMHESSFPYPVEHVVSMGRTVYRDPFGAPDEHDAELVRQAMELCGIAHLAQRPCTALSGGEMQMALLARALVQDAPLIVLDEPTAHLDFRNELVFLETIEKLVCESSVTVIMATHSPNQAFHLSAAGLRTSVALMSGGIIAEFGSPDQVLNEQALARHFGVRAYVGAFSIEDESLGSRKDMRQMQQIVPLASTAISLAETTEWKARSGQTGAFEGAGQEGCLGQTKA